MRLRDCVLLVVVGLCGVAASMLALDYAHQDARRRAVEFERLVCFDGDKIATGDTFTECHRMIMRRADEAGIR